MSKKLAKIVYSSDKDAYKLMISTDGGEEWDLCSMCQCIRSEKDTPDAEPNFVSYILIEEIRQCIYLGYKFVV